MLEKDIDKILFTHDEIEERCKVLGKQISEDYKGEDLLIVGILKGCVAFMQHLLENIDIYCDIDFMKVASYNGIHSTGNIIVRSDLSADIVGRKILLVEDIVDTGLTVQEVRNLLLFRGAKDVKVCSLLHKGARTQFDNKIDYLGFEVDNFFVVGFGLDYNEKYRNLPYIGVLKEEVYK